MWPTFALAIPQVLGKISRLRAEREQRDKDSHESGLGSRHSSLGIEATRLSVNPKKVMSAEKLWKQTVS